jgi:hypothetical protein
VWTPAEAVHWVPDTERPEGATTRFTIQLIDPAWDSGPLERPWVWSPGNQSLDFAQLWPGEWVARRPGISAKTGWFRWDSEPWLTTTHTPVLACVDTIFPDSAEWPDVRYNNYAYATLTSGPLDSSVRGVRLIHAIEGDLLTGAVGRDGGQVVWVAPDGSEHPVEPVDGWQAQVHAQVYTPQSGQGVLVGTTPFLREGLPVWHTDVFPVPADSVGTEGEKEPWRLRLVFGSDQSRYYRGWFIASIEPLYDAPPASALAVDWNSELSWDWPAPLPAPPSFLVEEYLPAAEDWVAVIETAQFADPLSGGYRLSRSEVLDRLQEKGRKRTRIRIVGGGPFGVMASRPLVIYPDGGPAAPALLGAPWPNPSRDGTVRFLAEIPAEQEARVTVYDLRGRLIQSWALPSGNHFLLWEGSDSAGRRVASGTYLLRLEGSGAVISRKVVLLH